MNCELIVHPHCVIAKYKGRIVFEQYIIPSPLESYRNLHFSFVKEAQAALDVAKTQAA